MVPGPEKITMKAIVVAGHSGTRYNPSTLWGQGRQITWGQEFKTGLANMVKPHLH